MATEVLRSVAATPPADWFEHSGSDSRVLGQLVRSCVSSVTWSDLKRDEAKQLHALFDLVLDHGLGSVIVDFIWEVCANPAMASSDPNEAYLMDWQCLRQALTFPHVRCLTVCHMLVSWHFTMPAYFLLLSTCMVICSFCMKFRDDLRAQTSHSQSHSGN